MTSNYSNYSNISEVPRGRNSDFGGHLENGGHFITDNNPENGGLNNLNNILDETSKMFEPGNGVYGSRRSGSLLSLTSYSSGSLEPVYSRQPPESLGKNWVNRVFKKY